ncbi:MAG: hypothetical protein CL920_22095 [Deltaproteobacteria bacterium]|nr:hypothetical protein [Deltaproteobacteria bacterium]MBU51390.1 hypothetical protein [Deltaproteobacteria bacterium]|tara:strand:+ start:1424 stop:2074 length:651 start_codon:yes stop_codon:yes gene_type:complete
MQEFLLAHAAQGYILVFTLLVLGGLNAPVSEDLVVITGGYMAAMYGDHTYTMYMYLAIFLGTFVGDSLVFTIGKFFGPPLLKTAFFAKILPPERREVLDSYFKKYGMMTLFFGRFIPFGVRNGLFLTAATSKVRYFHFVLVDLCALTLSTGLMFWLGYAHAERLELVITWVRRSSVAIFVVALVVVAFFVIRWYRKRRESGADSSAKTDGAEDDSV